MSDIDIEAMRETEVSRLVELYRVCKYHAATDLSEDDREHARQLLPHIEALYRMWAGRPIDDKTTDTDTGA